MKILFIGNPECFESDGSKRCIANLQSKGWNWSDEAESRMKAREATAIIAIASDDNIAEVWTRLKQLIVQMEKRPAIIGIADGICAWILLQEAGCDQVIDVVHIQSALAPALQSIVERVAA